jgi:hypothetical protein
MRHMTINRILNLWFARSILSGLVIACGICLLLTATSAEIFGQSAALASANPQSSSKTPKEIEYEVKAAFIYNFMKFVEWPPKKKDTQDRETNPENRMIIGILGVNPFGDAFSPILDKEVHDRKIHLIQIPSFMEFVEKSANERNAFADYQAQYQKAIRSCNVLFICESEKKYAAELLRITTGSIILTVSDLPEFAKQGGIIGFVKDKNKIRFEINLATAQKENIKIRSQLLTLAKEVYNSN